MSKQRNNKNFKNSRRRRNNNNRQPYRDVVPRPFALPQNIMCTEKYDDMFGFSTGAAGVPANYVYRMNSTFDPDLTGTGHQPYGRDTLAGLYNKYRVMEFAWNIEAVIISSACFLAVVPCPDNTITFASVNEAGEQPYAKSHPVAGTYLSKFSGKVKLPNLLGQSISTYRGDDSNESVVGASPNNVPALQLVIQGYTSTLATVALKVQLTYTVEYFILKSLVQS